MRAGNIKIFVDAHVFDKEFQGAQTFLRELYTRLLLDHPELDIYFGACDTENIRRLFPGLPPENILPYKKRRPGILRLVFDIPAYIKKYRFNFAHFQYTIPKRIAGCQYIVTLHDVLFNDFKKDFNFFFRISRNWLFGSSIRQAPIKTTVSAYSKQQICHYYGIPAAQVHVIPNGVNELLAQGYHSKQAAMEVIYQQFGIRNFILYVSRIEPRKNQLLLLKHFLKLRLYQKDIALVFIGKESMYIPALAEMIAQLDEQQKQSFYWLKQATQADLVAFYRACRLFVYPSKAEGFGIPPLEAAICQAPVLCSSATSMQDFGFFAPYTFDPANEEDFERQLSQMIAAPPADVFINKVAEQVKQRYNWQQSSQLFYQLLQVNQ